MMNLVLIEQVQNIKELVDFILNAKETTKEHIAVAIDEQLFDFNAVYQGRIKPSKKTLLKLCNLYCLICLEKQGYS